MGAQTLASERPRAVLLDAMGTLLTFEPPAPHLRAALEARVGVDVGEVAARAAIRAEIAFYRAHLHLGGDAAGLAALRRASAEAMRPALPPAAADADGDALTAALLDALRFVAFPDARPLLAALRGAGIRAVVASNWDASLHDRLTETGLADLLDGAVASAEAGSAKPDTAIFERALAIAGVRAHETWHVGDSEAADVAGAAAAGLRPVLLVRDGEASPADGSGEPGPPPAAGGSAGASVPVIGALTELPRLWGDAPIPLVRSR